MRGRHLDATGSQLNYGIQRNLDDEHDLCIDTEPNNFKVATLQMLNT